MGKRPKGGPRKTREEGNAEDARNLGIRNWWWAVVDRDEWGRKLKEARPVHTSDYHNIVCCWSFCHSLNSYLKNLNRSNTRIKSPAVLQILLFSLTSSFIDRFHLIPNIWSYNNTYCRQEKYYLLELYYRNISYFQWH